MKIQYKSVSFILVLIMLAALITPLGVSAKDYEYDMYKSTVFHTSYNSANDIVFTIKGDKLTVEGCLMYENLESIWVRVEGDTMIDKMVSAKNGKKFSCTLSLRKCLGRSDLCVYALKTGASSYWGYVWKNLYINTDGKGNYWIEQNGEAFSNNSAIESAWLNPAECLNKNVADEIKDLAKSILGNETNDYSKAYKLYDWVIRNIYFDYDYYYGRSSVLYLDPVDIAKNRRTNCAGYAYILAALYDAAGLPNTVVNTYSLGISTTGVYDVNLNRVSANHAHNEVFVDGRWVVVDPTWDTQNKYDCGGFITISPNGHLYFDISAQMLAVNHYIIERKQSSAEDTPSSWAQSEISRSLKLGIIPASLQGGYRKNITRGEFCALAVAMYEKAGGEKIKKLATFSDSNDINVRKMGAVGVLQGVGGNKADPNGTLTREQAATMLARLADALGKPLKSQKLTYSDKNDIAYWAYSSVGMVSGSGIMNGVGDSRFSPKGSYTREQSIATMLRLYDYVSK